MQFYLLQNIFSVGFWSQVDQVRHPELKLLFQKLASTALQSKANSTVSKYAYAFKRFLLWTRKYSEITTVLPCNELYISLYLQHLLDTVKHHSVIESALYGIKWAHKLAGVTDTCDSDIVRSVLEASKRILTRPIKKKDPVNPNIMHKLFEKFNKQGRSLKDLRLVTMCVLCYTGFLRYDELCSIRANNITFLEDHMIIFIAKSKTDCYRKGKSVYIAKLSTSLCPVNTLCTYLQEAKIDVQSNMYIFRSLSYLKKSDKFVLRNRNEKLSYTRARELVKSALQEIGEKEANFGLHSFRSGGATTAANYGISDRLFKIHGRWRSELAKDGYVSENLQKRLSVTKNLGI